jgi:hypothetical protein|tara:strand:- start:353 stop:757 length:405 start_codon:yes stop_codon:yes gene_type:complete
MIIPRKGFTLTELLLAVGFLVFALSSSLILFANCILLNEYNRSLSIAASHAQYVMEEIKDTNFSSVKTNIDNGNWDWDTSDIAAKGLSSLGGESIDANESGTSSELLNVTITVNWQARNGRARSTFLETLIVEP